MRIAVLSSCLLLCASASYTPKPVGFVTLFGVTARNAILPLAFESRQASREIQGPMAIVILGGLITSTLMSLLVLPALIWRFRHKPQRSLS